MPTTRHATVTTPASQELLLVRMHAHEALSQPFVYELELVSESFDIKSEDLLNQSVTVHVETVNKELRHFNGVCTRFSYAGARGRYAAYRATLRPWLWLLTHQIGNAVFQDKNIPDLVSLMFRLNGFKDVEPVKLSGTYDKREFVVQYRESLFDFVSRWLEHEGIHYSFKHEDGSHKLQLADDSTSGSTVSQYEELSYRPPMRSGREETDHFEDWGESSDVITEVCAVDGYNFKQPRVNLLRTKEVPQEKQAARVALRAPDTHLTPEVGDRYAQLHSEVLRAGKTVFEGSGNVRGLHPGALFKLADHPRKALNQQYCVISTDLVVEAGEFESSHASAPFHIRSRVRAIEASVPFRPAHRTPRPVAAGPESAVVVGTEGSEISTEKYGRIRVQFHWDKEHEKNEDSSCWMRVAQPWAGADFGFQFIPRVGHEVLVSFLNGDPDQPVVVGSVYNDDNQPPFKLDKHCTQSGIRTRSSKGGGKEQYNELRFEDDKGHEEVYLQAERNLRELVKNDHQTQVNANQKNTVDKDQTEEIKGKQALTVKGIRTVHVEGSQSTTVDGNAAADGVSGSKLAITGDYKVDVSQTISIQAPVSIRLECGASSILIEPTKISVIAGGQAVLVLDTNVALESAAGSALKVDTGVLAQALLGGKLELNENASLEGLQSTLSGKLLAQTCAGANSVKADPSGVSLMGTPMVKIN
jgi:type VI secretion system secreted protein VgrG